MKRRDIFFLLVLISFVSSVKSQDIGCDIIREFRFRPQRCNYTIPKADDGVFCAIIHARRGNPIRVELTGSNKTGECPHKIRTIQVGECMPSIVYDHDICRSNLSLTTEMGRSIILRYPRKRPTRLCISPGESASGSVTSGNQEMQIRTLAESICRYTVTRDQCNGEQASSCRMWLGLSDDKIDVDVAANNSTCNYNIKYITVGNYSNGDSTRCSDRGRSVLISTNNNTPCGLITSLIKQGCHNAPNNEDNDSSDIDTSPAVPTTTTDKSIDTSSTMHATNGITTPDNGNAMIGMQSTMDTTNDSRKGSDQPVAALSILPIVLPIVVLVVLIALIVFFFLRYNKRRSSDEKGKNNMDFANATYSQNGATTTEKHVDLQLSGNGLENNVTSHDTMQPDIQNTQHLQGDGVEYNSCYAASSTEPNTQGEIYNAAYQSVEVRNQNPHEYTYIDTELIKGEQEDKVSPAKSADESKYYYIKPHVK